jgi:mannose-6-phosphate isomerase-like protein (cupin superfamily)
MSKECAKEERNMEYDGNTTDGVGERVVYSSQPQDLRAENNYLTSLSFQLDDYCVLAAQMPAGVVVPLHSHSDRESFYLLSGEMTFYDGDSWRILRQGNFVDVPGNTKHAWRNASESSASLLVATTVRMGIFLQRVSSSVETKLAPRATSRRQEHFFKLVQEDGYWMGSPADNKAIGLSSDWHSTADQNHMADA